MLPHVRAVWK